MSTAAGDVLSDAQVDAIHERKTELACAEVATGVDLRPGIAHLIEQAFEQRIPIAFVTSTYRPNIDAIARGAGAALPLEGVGIEELQSLCANGQ